MNVRRGAFRLWMLASVLWTAYWSWHLDVLCVLGYAPFGGKPWCQFSQLVQPAKVLFETSAVLFGAPLLAGLVGLAIAWAVNGFRRT